MDTNSPALHPDMTSGNAMTTSTLSACIFALMCFALPTSSGKTVFQAPSPKNLPKGFIHHWARSVSGSDEEEETLVLGGNCDVDQSGEG